MEKEISGCYCVGDVEAVLSKFKGVFSTVKTGSIISLHISKNCGESFTLKKTSASFEVRSGDSADADLVLDIDKPVFEKIKATNDLSGTLRAALKSKQARVDLKADELTLYLKGYLGVAQKLGLL